MKFRIQLKDPDGFDDGVNDAVQSSLAATDLPDDEKEALEETRAEKTWISLEKWVEYKEYVTIEFDTEAGTATVVPR